MQMGREKCNIGGGWGSVAAFALAATISLWKGNAIKLSEICGDSFCDKVAKVAQDSQVSQVPRMR